VLDSSSLSLWQSSALSSIKLLFGGEFSDPAGTKTPSASRYDLNWSGRDITVDFIDNEENVENQLEN